MEVGMSRVFREVVEPEVKRRVLVHPRRVKVIASAKLKNDRVDSENLAHLSRCVWGQFTKNLLR